MKEIDMKQINRLAWRGVAWVGGAAQFCLGLLAMLVLVVVMGVLTAVMLAATALPATVVRQKRDSSVRRDSENTPEPSATRKAVAESLTTHRSSTGWDYSSSMSSPTQTLPFSITLAQIPPRPFRA